MEGRAEPLLFKNIFRYFKKISDTKKVPGIASMTSSPVGSQCFRLQHVPVFGKRMMMFINLVQTRRAFSSTDKRFRYITPTG